MIATCGSGASACMIYLALRVIGHENVQVYDGSWSEYGCIARLDALKKAQ